MSETSDENTKNVAKEDEQTNGPTIERRSVISEPPPSRWRRLVLVAFVILFVYYFGLPLLRPKQPQIIYASRYSKEHKFRPAASPIITEVLKDGRTRLRGAYPTPAPTSTASPTRSAARRRPAKPGRPGSKARKRNVATQ